MELNFEIGLSLRAEDLSLNFQIRIMKQVFQKEGNLLVFKESENKYCIIQLRNNGTCLSRVQVSHQDLKLDQNLDEMDN